MSPSPQSRAVSFMLLLAAMVQAVGAQSPQLPDNFSVLMSVHDRESRAPIRMASIQISGSPQSFISDTTGRLALAARQGIVVLQVRALGYSPVDTTITLKSDTVISVALARAVQLDTVSATASATRGHLREFEFRRQSRTGRYLVESDLVAEGDRQFASVAATRFPGLKKVWDPDGQVHLASTRGPCGYQQAELSRRGGLSSCLTSKPCLVQMYLDGMRLSEDDFGLIKTQHLAAIEYYTGATVPAQYRIAGAACGVMLVWTKR